MANIVNVRALTRSPKIRVKNSSGVLTTLSATVDTKVDLDEAYNRKSLNSHTAIGQWVSSGTVIGQNHTYFGENKKLVFTSNTPGGGISRLIEFHMTTTYDRPWISWFDENNLHRAAVGYHTTDISEGGVHQAFELKTVADQTGLSPTDMRTRFSIGTNGDRVLTGFNYTTGIELNQGEVPTDTTGTPIIEQFGIKLRGYKRDGTTHGILGQFVVQTETTDAVTAFLDVVPLDTTKAGQLILMKSQNTSSGTSGIYVKKGDGTNADMFSIMNRTGVLRLYNAFTVPSANVTGAIQIYSDTNVLKGRDPSGNIVTMVGPPTAVTGAKGSNAALASLISALVGKGIITDSTTA